MSIAEDWRNLATDFERLDPSGDLVVLWKYFSATDGLFFTTVSSDNLIEAKFRSYCVKCGEFAELSDRFCGWLAEVKQYAANDLPDTGIALDPSSGKQDRYHSGRIIRPAEACSALCYRMEAHTRSNGSLANPLGNVMGSVIPKFRTDKDTDTSPDTQHDTSGTTETPRKRSLRGPALKTQLRLLRGKSRLTVERLAELVDIQPRSVYRHLAGVVPRGEQIQAYERVFTEELGEAIKIRIPGRRQ